MELKPGYKQTEIGVIPEEWLCAKLSLFAELESGHTPSRKNPKYWDGNIPWISLHDSRELDVPVIFNTSKNITQVGLANSSARLLPEGTVVFSRTATVGKATLMGLQMATSQDFANFICGKKVFNHFLVHLFRFMKNTWRGFMAGSTHNSIYMPVFKALKIPLPPLSEQEAIAGALSDTDALIEALEQLITKKRHIKQGAMQELLTGKKRLPGFETKPGTQQTEVGEIPADWATKSLSRLIDCKPEYGINAPAVAYDSRCPVYLRITDINSHGCLSDDHKVSIKHKQASLYYLKTGDIVFARTGSSVGKSLLYKDEYGPLVYAGFLIRVRPLVSALCPMYLAQFCFTQVYWQWVIQNSMRSGQPGLNSKDYGALQIPLPPTKAEQEAIAAVLSDMDAEISALETKLTKARHIKQGMMAELLTGRIRLI